MAQAKKKQSVKTAKKTTGAAKSKRTQSCRAKKAQQQGSDRMHIYIVTAMSMIAAILLCANAAMMIV